ncbi:MAG: FAD-dependent thymidylate synthase, partial [bacterium]|nr:FAD-dependent thymidylate synthase [bacterium]
MATPSKAKLMPPKDPSARRLYWMNRLTVERDDGTREELRPMPEVIAVAIAKCSRTDTPFDQNIDDVSLEKAAEFHEKWVVGYGHGSVAEHAVSSVAIENISQIAIKVLEDSRLASFTEKSSRYQVFSRERAYTPDAIKQSSAYDAYRTLLDRLYGLYQDLYEPVSALMRERFPQPPDSPEKAYQAQTKARTLDVARCLLPAAALGSLGMTANARVWEHV